MRYILILLLIPSAPYSCNAQPLNTPAIQQNWQSNTVKHMTGAAREGFKDTVKHVTITTCAVHTSNGKWVPVFKNGNSYRELYYTEFGELQTEKKYSNAFGDTNRDTKTYTFRDNGEYEIQSTGYKSYGKFVRRESSSLKASWINDTTYEEVNGSEHLRYVYDRQNRLIYAPCYLPCKCLGNGPLSTDTITYQGNYAIHHQPNNVGVDIWKEIATAYDSHGNPTVILEQYPDHTIMRSYVYEYYQQ